MPVRKQPALKGSDGKPFTITLNQFKGGTMTLLDESRTPQTAVVQSQNMMLDQDGVWVPRYGSQNYGAALTGPIDGIGTATKYNSDGTITTLLCAIDNGSLKTSSSGGPWTTITGFTWATGYPAVLKQINSRVYIANGKDKLAYYDIASATIRTFTALGTPSTPTLLARNTLTTGNYTMFYKVTAVKYGVGETIASSELSISVNKQRDAWLNNPTTQESLDLQWSAVTNADAYNIYYSNISGQEVFIDQIGATATPNYRDTGLTTANLYQAAPISDSTGGPTLGLLELSGNRIWACGDPNNQYRIYASSATTVGSFDPYQGAMYVDLNLGSDEKPIAIKNFRTGKGDQVATVLTSSPSGGGSVWFISLSSVTVDTVAVTIPTVISQGSIGSSSPLGVVSANNSVYYPSLKGFQSLGSAPNILNVLVTTEISANIRPNVRSILSSAAKNICGAYYLGRIFWSVPYGSTTNNQVWVLDLERQAWCIAWNIGVKQFLEYTDSSGTVHLLAIPVTGTSLIEFSDKFTGDSGAAFPLNLSSGLIYWEEDHSLWARVDKVYFELGRPKGNVNLTISGTQKNKNLSQISSKSLTDTVSSSGLGSDLLGTVQLGDSANVPTSFAQSSVKKRVLVKKRLNNLKWSISSSDVNASFSLLEIVIKGKILASSDPQNWK